MQNLHGTLFIGNQLDGLGLAMVVVNDLNVLLLCVHLQYLYKRADGFLWIEKTLMKAEVIIPKMLVCNEILDMELDAVRAVKNCIKCFTLAIVTSFHKLLRHHYDRVLRLLDTLSKAIVGYSQIFLSFLFELVL